MAKYRNKVSLKKSDMPVLVVIDMQENFTSDKTLINQVELEITNAVAEGLPVVLVRYLYCGEIHQQLLDAAQIQQGDPLRFIVAKSDDNGAREILGTCRKNGVNMGHLRICGVNTNACVLDTTLELARLLPKSQIELLGYACRNQKTANDFGQFKGRNIIVTATAHTYSNLNETLAA